MAEKRDRDKVPEQPEKQNRGFAAQAVSMTTVVGGELTVMTILGYYCGQFLDHKFDTSPWLMLAGVMVGLAVGFIFIIKTIKWFFAERK